MSMMTRKATTRDMETKLRIALEELKTQKILCAKLLQERDDSEEEVKNIINRNSQLKRELATLHQNHLEVLNQKDHLQEVVDKISDCSDTYERALTRINELEVSLCQAHDLVNQLEQEKQCQQEASIHSLYDELLGTDAVPTLVCAETIDLTDVTVSSGRPVIMGSHKKLKKYIRINKFITKTRKLIKTQGRNYKYNQFRIQREKLLDSLNSSEKKLKETLIMYDSDMERLLNELKQKDHYICGLVDKYEMAQKTINEQIQAASHLLDISKYNEERFDSLVSKQICHCSLLPTCTTQTEVSDSVSEVLCHSSNKLAVSSNDTHTPIETVVFSDCIGKSLGPVLNAHITGNVINYCMPGASYNQIVDKIKCMTFGPHTNVVIMIGKGLGVNKNDLIDSLQFIPQLNTLKTMLCAFPYSQCYTEKQNLYIGKLNNILYLTCHHSDNLIFFDTNKFISGLEVTRDSFFVPRKFKHLIATLVAYNINGVIATITNHRLSDETFLYSDSSNKAIGVLNH